jgi:lipopolysaccharide export system protein LptA
VATFISPTYIYNEEQIVYCEKGFFDSKKRNAEFAQNAYYINRLPTKTEKAKADRILYDGATGNYYLYGNASYSDGNQQVLADTIVRDGQTERYSFRGNPLFKSLDSTKTETISSRNSYYDPQSKIMYFSDSVLVVRNEQRLWADSLAYQEKEKKGRAKGNVVWNDTIQKTTLYCGEAHYNDSAKTVLAFKEPIFQLNLDGDSLWLKADTFYSFVLPLDTLARDSNQVDSFRLDSTERRALKAYHRVQIFKSNFQGLCDSLYYSDKDSIFQFFRAPVLWADSSQFTADTIFLKMRKGKIDQIRLRNNSFIINSEDEVYFNQIKGRNILAQFEAGELRSMDIDAQAETVYYARDESRRYLGVNDVDANRMLVRFGNNQVKRIHFYEEPKAVLYPMRQIDHNKLRLSGFDWQEAKRPRQRFVWQMPVQ